MISPSARIWALTSGYPGEKRRKRFLMAAIYQAYVDDSGKGQPPAFVLAGFVATSEGWAAFSEDWAAALLGPPKLEYFKMKEAASCHGQFEGWKESDRNERLLALIEIIERYAILGIASVVHQEDYKKVFKGKIAKGMDSPYHLSFYSVMQSLIRIQRYVGDENATDFIFDEQGKEIGRALKSWKAFVKFAPPQVGNLIGSPPISRDEKTTLPLQAADLLAWRTRRHIVDLITGDDVAERLLPFKTIDVFCDTWNRKRLAETWVRLGNIKHTIGGVFPYDLKGEERRKFEKALAAGRIRAMAEDL